MGGGVLDELEWEEYKDMISAFAFVGLADEGVGARKSRSNMLLAPAMMEVGATTSAGI